MAHFDPRRSTRDVSQAPLLPGRDGVTIHASKPNGDHAPVMVENGRVKVEAEILGEIILGEPVGLTNTTIGKITGPAASDANRVVAALDRVRDELQRGAEDQARTSEDQTGRILDMLSRMQESNLALVSAILSDGGRKK